MIRPKSLLGIYLVVSCCFYVAYPQEMNSSEDKIINVELDMDLKRQENETTMTELTTITKSMTTIINPPKCFFDLTVKEVETQSATLEIRTNLQAYILNSINKTNKTITLYPSENDDKLGDVKFQSIKLYNLKPMDKYLINLDQPCKYEKKTIETAYEVPDCVYDGDYSWNCKALKCSDGCFGMFKLINMLTVREVNKLKEKVKCGLLQASVYLFKKGFTNSTNHILKWKDDEDFLRPTDSIQNLGLQHNTFINESNQNIIEKMNITKNIWIDCPDTNLNISLKRDLCETSGFDDIDDPFIADLYQKSYIDDIVFDLGNEGSYANGFLFTFKTSYFNGKRNGSLNLQYSTKSEEFLDKLTIHDLSSTEDTISFSYRKPYKCYDNFTVKCINDLSSSVDITQANLDADTQKGSCTGLVSGRQYIIMSTVQKGKIKNEIKNTTYTALSRVEHFKFLNYETSRAQFVLVIKGSCQKLELCSGSTCAAITSMNSRCFNVESNVESKGCDCQYLGRLNVTIQFNFLTENFLKYGERQVFYIKTVGYQEGAEIDSNTDEIKIELDKVNVTAQLRSSALVGFDSISFDLKKDNVPKGTYTSIRIACDDQEEEDNPVDTFTDCAKESIGYRCVCSDLLAGSSYDVKFQTYKNGSDWQPVVIRLKDIYNTTLFPPNNVAFNQTNVQTKAVVVQWTLPPKRYTGFKFTVNDKDKECAVIDPSLSNRQLTFCSMDNDVASYVFKNLDPGTQYNMTIRTYKGSYHQKYSKEKILQVFTDFDPPVLIDSQFDKTSFTFKPPETKNCSIIFTLVELSGSESVKKMYQYKCEPVPEKTINLDVSLSIGKTYRIDYEVSKEFNKQLPHPKPLIGPLTGELVNSLEDGYIALIAIVATAIVIAPIVIFFIVKKRKKLIYVKRYQIKPEKLGVLLEEWDQTQNSGCTIEWEELASVTKNQMQELNPTYAVAKEPENRMKNRYMDILPYDHSRVKLVTVDDEDCDYTDFINANFIPGLKSHTKYIACQGPLKSTTNDFWSMVMEQKVSIIVMLTQVQEGEKKNLRVKCETYWPDKKNSIKIYGDIKVTLLSTNPQSDFIIRKFRMESGVIKQYVRQYQYLTWPDRKFPKTDILYDFMYTIRQNSTRMDNRGPVVVHCSAGVGRTGTFIAIENIIEKLHKNMPVDVFDTVLEMRKYRVNMVQNQFQYRFIYDMIYYYYQKDILKKEIKKSRLDSVEMEMII